jgi:membrane-associated phospholipid phosphatase
VKPETGLWREAWSDAKTACRDARAMAARNWRIVAAFAVIVAAATAYLVPRDLDITRRVTAERTESGKKAASLLRKWGDFRDTVTYCGLLFAAGALAKRRHWRRAAVTAFTAACIAGLTANVFRFGLGRPRPSVVLEGKLPDRLTGPTLVYANQSFPSGHATTSTACGIALLVLCPPLGVPATLTAGGVIWASHYRKNHYASDLLAGASLGLTVGLLFSLPVRRRKQEPVPAVN